MEVRCPLYQKCEEAPNCGAAKPHDERYCEPCPRNPGLTCKPYASIVSYVIGENTPSDNVEEYIKQIEKEVHQALITPLGNFVI